MKDFRFYLEYPSDREKRKPFLTGKHTGNCIAVCIDEKPQLNHASNKYEQGCFAAVQDIPDNPCCYTSVSWAYLSERCKRVSEKKAREIHPNLFYRIEQN